MNTIEWHDIILACPTINRRVAIAPLTLVVAGGRGYDMALDDYVLPNAIRHVYGITELVHGCCRGVDTDCGKWAESRGITVKEFPADWKAHGRAAGPIRNRQMAEYVASSGNGALVTFRGGKGTANMKKQAAELGLMVFDAGERK